jgi:hypothetical protein
MPTTIRRTLLHDERASLAAVVRTVLPRLHESKAPVGDPLRIVEDRLCAAPAAVFHDLALALRILASRPAGLVVAQRWARFTDLPDEARARAFEAWSTSGIHQARSIHQALRRFGLSTWYATARGRQTRIRYAITAADRTAAGHRGSGAAALRRRSEGRAVAAHTAGPGDQRAGRGGPARCAGGPESVDVVFSARERDLPAGVEPRNVGSDARLRAPRRSRPLRVPLLPTPLGVNPQETIMAMASLMAERLVR